VKKSLGKTSKGRGLFYFKEKPIAARKSVGDQNFLSYRQASKGTGGVPGVSTGTLYQKGEDEKKGEKHTKVLKLETTETDAKESEHFPMGKTLT